MYAIVEIKGSQFKVEENKYLYVPSLNLEVGASVAFDKVLLVNRAGDILVGAPLVEGVLVYGKVLGNIRSDKVTVFKKKRRKKYQKKSGHRQGYTKIFIESIK